MTDDIDMTGWPTSLRDIADMIGPGPALRLIDAYSGKDYVWVPKEFRMDHELVQAIGEEAARALIERAGNGRIQIPTLAVRRILRRKRLIRDAHGTTSEIAQRFGVSPRWVRYVKSETKAVDTRQLDMFAPARGTNP